MKQKGLVVNSSPQIDDLTYSYNENSNKLQSVSDIGVQSLTMNLGDFHDRNTDGDDYGYDVNGNMITDKNKAINGNTGVDQQNGAIIYNHLNLPYQVKMQNDDGSNKGTITYIYDASGNKLEKRVNEFAGASNNNTAVATNTTYLGGAVYQNNILQFFAHEEGRIRPIQATDYNNNQVFAYDYFVKDHLGNTRVVLTDELQQDVYPAATLEDGGNSVESAYYNINVGNIVNTPDEIQGWYANNNELPPNPDPNIDVNASSTRMYRLNGASGDKVGLGIALKVMTGDNVTIFGKSFWTNAGTPIDNNNYNIVASSLLSLFAGTSAVSSVEGGNASSILNSQITPDELTTLLQNNEPAVTNKPKAFVNWILFDEQFQPVASSSGFDPVDDNPDEAYEHINSVNISQSGYLYVYCSNESNVDVLFDNLQVVHTKGALLETTHYYPFGLTMAGISDNAIKSSYSVNKYKYNGKELQNDEFSDGTGLEEYDYGARIYDPQISRMCTIDPHADQYQSWTPYNYTFNNPVFFTDPDGRDGEVTYTHGNGTKKDPNIITIKANYYYNKNTLSEKQAKALDASISEYNSTQTSTGKEKDGSYTIIKYDLSAKGFANDDDVSSAVAGDQFTNSKGGTSSFGNTVTSVDGPEDASEGKNALGDESNGRKITLFNNNIKKATDAGNDEASTLKNILNHEIGHNLGGEHGDASPMAATMTFGRQKPDCLGNCWVPDVPTTPVSNRLAPTLLQRIENPVDRKYLKYQQGATPPSSN